MIARGFARGAWPRGGIRPNRRFAPVVAQGALGLPLSIFLILFGLIPIGTLFVYSLWTATFLGGVAHVFTLDNYRDLVIGPTSEMYLTVLRTTYLLSITVTLVTLAIGLPAAYYMSRYVRGNIRMLIFTLFFVPLVASYLVKIYAWRGVLGEKGLINYLLVSSGLIDEPLEFLMYNRFAVALALVSASIPFMILPIYASVERIPESLFEASTDLGASTGRIFWHVVVPLSRRGIVAGCTLVFVMSFGDFVASQLLGGASGILIGKVIYSYFGLANNWPGGAAMAFASLAVAAVTIGILGWFARGGVRENDFALGSDLAR